MKTWLILGVLGILGLNSDLGPKGQSLTVKFIRGPAATTSQEFNFNDLTSALKTHSFSKMDDFLAHVKARDPKFMSRYVTAYASKSLHESSKEYPRMIVFGETAKTILTFNGHENQVSYNLLEVMHFNETTKKFEFYEIEFREKGDLKEPYTISENGGPEGKCLACHTNGRPIWHNSGLWPGMFGEEDNFPIYRGEKNDYGKSVLSSGIPGVQERLEREWSDFKTVTMAKARYRQLGPQKVDSMPNSELTAALYRLNYKRMANEIKQSSAMRSPIREKLMYAGFCQTQDFYQKSNEVVDLYNKFSKIHKKNLHELAMTELMEISFNMNIDWKDIQRHYPMPVAGSSQQDFFANFLKLSTKIATTSHYGVLAKDIMPKAAFLAAVEKYVPELDIENWPMNFVPGTQIYNDGLEVDTFKAMIFETLFLEEERASHIHGAWCSEMEKKLRY